MNNKKLTIIMPVFNGWPYIKESVESILGQKYSEFYFLVINDGSNDSTLEYLNTIKDNRLKIINKNHSGIIDSFNLGLKYSDTEYIARVDSDDIYHKDKFKSQIEFLELNKNIGVLGTGIQYFGSRRYFFTKIYPPQNNELIIKNIFNKTASIINTTTVYRKKYVDIVNGLRNNIYPEDVDLFLRLGKHTKLSNLKSVLTFVRIHESYSYNNLKFLLNKYDAVLSEHKESYKNIITSANSDYINNLLILYKKGLYHYLNKSAFIGLVLLLLPSILKPNIALKRIIDTK